MKARRLSAHALVFAMLFLTFASTITVWTNSLRPVYAPPTAATLTEWLIPTASSTPTALALDPSGNCCWFVEVSGNKIVHFDPSTNTFQEWTIPTANSQPVGLATTTIAGMTAVWGTEFNANKVFVFFPSTGIIKEYTLPNAGSGPEYISIEPSGAQTRVWFTEIMRNAWGEIVYDHAVASATLFEDTFPVAVGGGANGVYAGSGIIWFAGISAMVRYDRSTVQYSMWPLPSHGSAKGAFLAVDNIGQVWYTQGVNTAGGTDNYVGVLRGDNTFKDWQIPTTGADPRVISINPVTQQPWIAEYAYQANDGKIAALDSTIGGTVSGGGFPSTAPYAGSSGANAPAVLGPIPVTPTTVSPSSSANTGTTTGAFTEWDLGANSEPHDVIVDASGNAWILESSANKLAKLTITAPDFSLAPSASTVSVSQGSSASITVTGTSILSFSGAVTLSITGSVPSGVSFSSFSPNPISVPAAGSASATLTINADPSAPAGTSTITISGTSGPTTHTTTFSLTITSGADFSFSLSASSLTVGSGSSATDTVTVTSLSGFNSAVALSAGVLPAGVHVSFSPSSPTPPSGGSTTSTATISVDPGTPPSMQTITITGTSGSLTHSQSLTLTITVTPDFTITASPSSFSITQGAIGTSTINVGSTNGFSSAVSLAYSWIGTAPSGVSVSLPGPVTPPSGSSATSTLTVSASSSASTGAFTLSITGTSDSLTHSVNVGLEVTSATTTTTPPAPKCLIATATYGSELAPEVQLLRNFRDNSIMRTNAGSNFMTAFNAWYYSFSPYVAAYLSNHWIERTVMKGALYPLIGILGLSSATYSMTNAYPEMAALLSGLVASSLIGAFYVGLPLGVLRAKIRRLRGNRSQEIVTKALGIAVIAGLLALTVGELLVSPITLMISSSIIVLSTLLLAASVTSATLARRIRKLG